MDAKEKRQVETQLLRMGLAGLQANGQPTGELVQQIAEMVNSWPGMTNRTGEWIDRHKFLRDLLAECDQKDRYEMYSAILPHLKFPAKSLSYYEMLMTHRMSSLVTRGAARVEGRSPHPIEVNGKKYVRVKPISATGVVATLKCHKCSKAQHFLADTPAGAMIAGRRAGWTRDKAVQKETCPECSKKNAS